MRGLDARAEAKYLDQINDASTVLYERAAKFRDRKTNPAPENNFVKKIVVNIKRRMKSFGDPYEKAKSLSLLGFNYDDKMSALIDEQFSKRATKPKYSAAAVNKAIASSRSKISASEGKTIHRLLKGRHGNPAAAMMTGYQVICMHPKKHVVGVFKTMAEAKQIATAMANAKGVAYGVKAVKVHKAHFAA